MPLIRNREVACDISAAELARLNNSLKDQTSLTEEEILAMRELVLRQVTTVKEQRALEEWLTNDPAMLELKDRVTKIAARSEPVLITGATGVGKGKLARAISVPGRPFITATCGGLPRELVSSLFFGSLKGSYTGSLRDVKGYLVAAQDGVVFLDEIGDLPMENQATLLHAIQEHEVYPVGASTPVSVDCRFIAATNYDLQERIKQGSFRRDLFARLSVFHLHITPLTARPGDIELIARALGYKGDLPFPDEVLARIETENVRAIESAIIRYEAYGAFD
jgi:DNA-binding NtrC family response regulator